MRYSQSQSRSRRFMPANTGCGYSCGNAAALNSGEGLPTSWSTSRYSCTDSGDEWVREDTGVNGACWTASVFTARPASWTSSALMTPSDGGEVDAAFSLGALMRRAGRGLG
jgi:hypothetical protein